MSMQPRPLGQVPEQTMLVARAAFPKGSLPMSVRDQLGEVFCDERFAAAFGVRGAPATSPGVLALVTALQYAEGLTDRQAAQMVVRAIDWKYCLGLELTDTGFDYTVLSKFRARLVEHGLERVAFDLLLAALTEKGLVGAGGKARTDSTHVISAVRDLNRLELAGESVRAALEVLAVAAPAWLATVIDIGEWAQRYGARVDSWRLPSSQAKRDRLAQVYGTDAARLLRAVWSPTAPAWLAQLPAIETLRQVLVQNYHIGVDARGREVIKQRQADDEGLPPARTRITSPYDLDTRWAAKGDDLFWNGYKVHLTETCHAGDDPPTDNTTATPAAPNLIINVATTEATVPDVKATTGIHADLAEHGLLPDEHYLDAGYPSAETITTALDTYRVQMITPASRDTSPQARAGLGFAKNAFTIDWALRQVTCPQGNTSLNWTPASQRDTEVIVVKFGSDACDPCPARTQCTTSQRGRRQLTLRPQELHEALARNRAQQDSKDWQHTYALRAGVEGTISQAIAITGIRHARYRGLPKTRLQHAFTAIALNLIRLDAWWNRQPLDRTRTSHLTRLDYTLAA
ncbi:IS1182 family transposase [Micromonospora sicca]|uniref:IS1182 family transposase n=1 Tax=Micromonospora sicca TaxID=2202420 RepID=A0A317DJ76_9ACTN|nr:IS1182 family transposase [Micromonospora sp. 4G51]PWR14698.1 IS1182 family transposase [Micromonospora sp. 4G51]